MSLPQTSRYVFSLHGVRWTRGKTPARSWKEAAALSRRVRGSGVWLADSCVLQPPRLSVLMKGGKHPLSPPLPSQRRCSVTGLTVIWGDVLSADFQIHISLRSDEIEAAWKPRRGDWHVWVALWARRCKPHANALSCICLYILNVCVCLHNAHALCFTLTTHTHAYLWALISGSSVSETVVLLRSWV